MNMEMFSEEGTVCKYNELEERCKQLKLEVQKKMGEREAEKLRFKELEERITESVEQRCKYIGALEVKIKDLEERIVNAEEKYEKLELEFRKKMGECEALEHKFSVSEVRKLSIENELKDLKRTNKELEKRLVGAQGEIVEKDVNDIVDLAEDEEDKVVQLMIENKVLETEKRQAESEVEKWKKKFMELESLILQMQENSKIGGESQLLNQKHEMVQPKDTQVASTLNYLQGEEELVNLDSILHSGREDVSSMPAAACTPLYDTPYKLNTSTEGKQRGHFTNSEPKNCSRVRKPLAFNEERSPSKAIAPATPGGPKSASFCVIDISDSDEELCLRPGDDPAPVELNVKGHVSVDTAFGETAGCENKLISRNSVGKLCEEKTDQVNDNAEGYDPYILTPKRKRASNVVTDDSDSDDDNIPISKLMKMRRQKSVTYKEKSVFAFGGDGSMMDTAVPVRRRLTTLRQIEEKGGVEQSTLTNLKASTAKYHQGIPVTESVDDSESEELESNSEDDSLEGFIVDSSSESTSVDASLESLDQSDEEVNFDEILSTLQRKKEHKLTWEFEADMLAAFGKDPELCMRAVCALYRKQTSDEKVCKETLYGNGRGFSKIDANRGSALAEFLTDGDPNGDPKKSVEDLKEYPDGLKLCKKLAARYSKQLFQIYQNKEDPFFGPP